MSKPEDMPGHILWFLLCPDAAKQGGQMATLLFVHVNARTNARSRCLMHTANSE